MSKTIACLTAPQRAPSPLPAYETAMQGCGTEANQIHPQPKRKPTPTHPTAKTSPHSSCRCFRCCDMPPDPPWPPAAMFCCSLPALILAISRIRSIAAIRLQPAQFSLMRTGSLSSAETASCVSWEAPQMDSFSGLAPSGIDLHDKAPHSAAEQLRPGQPGLEQVAGQEQLAGQEHLTTSLALEHTSHTLYMPHRVAQTRVAGRFGKGKPAWHTTCKSV